MLSVISRFVRAHAFEHCTLLVGIVPDTVADGFGQRAHLGAHFVEAFIDLLEALVDGAKTAGLRA